MCKTSLSKPNRKDYFTCNTCGSYVKDKTFYLSLEEEKAFYELHNNDIDDERYQQFTAPIWKYVLMNYSTDALGLDFGSGTGPVIADQLNKKGYKVNLYDPFFTPDQSVLSDIHYDYIFSCEVFEHLHHPADVLKKLTGLLKPNGKLIIMTLLFPEEKEFESWYYINDPTHVFIYTAKTIEYIAGVFKFKIIEVSPRFIVLQK